MAVLGCLAACMNTSSVFSRHREGQRERSYVTFTHLSKPICSKMFQFLHCIGKKRMGNLMISMKENGLAPRVHGNRCRKPKYALTFHSTEYVVRFLFNYAEQHALLLRGRVPGYSHTDIQLLPSSTTKRAIWRLYTAAAELNPDV